jgi:uncharacterized protein (DUF302 family)
MGYFISKEFTGTTVTGLRPKVEDALKTEGFGVLTEIDIQATMKKKLDKDYLPHLILGACNPVYADKVLAVDQHISLMLPCNITIRHLNSGKVEVAIINTLEAMKIISNPSVDSYANEINEKLNRVLVNI